jgi:hypothetical protein
MANHCGCPVAWKPEQSQQRQGERVNFPHTFHGLGEALEVSQASFRICPGGNGDLDPQGLLGPRH